jgi:hypothetical protein
MLRRHVAAVLAIGITAGDDDAARAAVKALDPIVRGAARRRFERALVDAALSCDVAGLTRPSTTHIMRLAALATAKQEIANAGDVEAVTEAYAKLPPRPLPRLPILTALSIVVAVAAIGFGSLAIVRASRTPPRTFAKVLPPASAKAFVDGGAPLHDPKIDDLLTNDLSDLVVDVSQFRRHRIASVEALRLLRDPPALVAHGQPLAKAWDDVLVELDATLGDHPDDELAPRLRTAVKKLSDAFAAVGLGYFLEGRFFDSVPLVQSYSVQEVVYVVANGTPRRVLDLRRLDRLNTRYALLGMRSEDLGDPVLFLDQIDEEVASRLIPSLAPDHPYPLGDDKWLQRADAKPILDAVSTAIRAEITAALGDDAPAAIRIGELLNKRAELIDNWRDALDQRHITIVATDDLFLPDHLLDNLAGLISKAQRERAEEIEAELAELEAPRIASRVHDIVAATVRRHEAQHGFDGDRKVLPQFPAALAAMVGAELDDSGKPGVFATAARHELSAYLSQIINDPVTPQLALWNLERQAFSMDRWRTAESYVAAIVMQGLARHLGIAMPEDLVTSTIERRQLGTLAIPLAKQPPEKLRAAASALWNELFGETMTTIVDRPH